MENQILVVDDDEGFRIIAADLLTKKGFEVSLADGGEKALEVLASGFRPSHIVTDLNMTPMNGIELSKSILKRASVPIFLCTADERAKQLAESVPGLLVIDKTPDAILAAITKRNRRSYLGEKH